MKKVDLSLLKTAVCLLFAFAAAACGEDDTPLSLADPRDMFADSPYSCTIRYNGTDYVTGKVLFSPNQDDLTKMDVRISGIMPLWEAYWDVTVDVKPETDRVSFAGKTRDEWYGLDVKGAWYPPKKKGDRPKLELTCNGDCDGHSLRTDEPYVFSLGENWAVVEYGGTAVFDYNGKTYSGHELMERVMGIIGREQSKSVESMSLAFRRNGTLDISFRYAGTSVYEPWMTVGYWIYGQNKMALELTEEQTHVFQDAWIGQIDAPYYTPLFVPYGVTSRYPLDVVYIPDGRRLGLSLSSVPLKRAFQLYAKGKGALLEDEEARTAIEAAVYMFNEVADANSVWVIPIVSD